MTPETRNVFLLLLCIAAGAGELRGQTTPTYRRGIQVQLFYGGERAPRESVSLYVPAADTASFDERGWLPTGIGRNDVEIGRTEYYRNGRVERYRFRTMPTGNNYNIQLRIRRRYTNGIEFGGGVFYGTGSYTTSILPADRPTKDRFYWAEDIDYRRLAASGFLGYNFFRNRRLQPFLGLQALVGEYRQRAYNRRGTFTRFPAEEEPVEGTFAGQGVFELRLGLLGGVSYVLSDDLSLSLELRALPADEPEYLGAALRYRLTNY